MKAIGFIIFVLFLFTSAVVYPFSFEDLDLKVKANLSESYDDNITSASANEKKDIITNINFGLGLEYEGKIRNFGLLANITRQIYAKYSDFDNTSESLTFNFQQELSKYDRISLKNRFNHTYEPRDFEDEFGRAGGRYNYYRNTFNLGYNKDISKQLSAGARFVNEIYTTSKEGSNDSYLNNIGFDGSYFLSSRDMIMVSYDFKLMTFSNDQEAGINSLSGGLRHYLTSQLYCDGRVGIDFIDSYNNEKLNELSFQASLTNDISENSTAGLTFSKQVGTKSYTADIFDYWQFSGALKRRIFERLSCVLSGFYGEGEYTAAKITDKLSGLSAGFSYDLSKDIKGNVSYSYSSTDSTDTSREYERNKILVSISANF